MLRLSWVALVQFLLGLELRCCQSFSHLSWRVCFHSGSLMAVGQRPQQLPAWGFPSGCLYILTTWQLPYPKGWVSRKLQSFMTYSYITPCQLGHVLLLKSKSLSSIPTYRKWRQHASLGIQKGRMNKNLWTYFKTTTMLNVLKQYVYIYICLSKFRLWVRPNIICNSFLDCCKKQVFWRYFVGHTYTIAYLNGWKLNICSSI